MSLSATSDRSNESRWSFPNGEARAKLENNLLVLMARMYSTQPLRVVRVLSKSGLAPEHFTDVVARDVFCKVLPGILSRKVRDEQQPNALRLLAAATNVDGNLEDLVEELSALGPCELEAR